MAEPEPLPIGEKEKDAWIEDPAVPDATEVAFETRTQEAVIKSKVVDKRISTLFFKAGENLIISRDVDPLLKREVPAGKKFEVLVTVRITDE